MEPKLFQIYLTEEQQVGYDAYIADNFNVNDRIASAVWRRAMQEFLTKRGYMKEETDNGVVEADQASEGTSTVHTSRP